jgi:acid phosphatase class B
MIRILADGRDDSDGRGLLLLSAFHLAASGLQHAVIHVVHGHDTKLRAGVAALRWDTGLRIAIAPRDSDIAAEMAGARLFVAVAARNTWHLPMSQAGAAGVRCLVPVQFPQRGAGPAAVAWGRAAHDTRALGALIIAALGAP